MKHSLPCTSLLHISSTQYTDGIRYLPSFKRVSHRCSLTRDNPSKNQKKRVAMAAKVHDEEAQQQEKQALLIPAASDNEKMTPIQRAISQTFKSTSHLAKLLPTGTVLAFQLLSPVFTNGGECMDVNRLMTACLIALCGLSCFVLSFSDSFKDGQGNVRYGFATSSGLWVIDGTAPLPPEIATQYKIQFIDFIHAVASVSVFAAVALFDQNVVSCFYPIPSEATKQVLTCLPIAIGVISSMLFVTFPTTRHGIGLPLSPY